MSATSKTGIKPTQQEIAARAYQIWERAGRKQGQDTKDWLQAEQELCTASQIAAIARANISPRPAAPASTLATGSGTGTISKINLPALPALTLPPPPKPAVTRAAGKRPSAQRTR